MERGINLDHHSFPSYRGVITFPFSHLRVGDEVVTTIIPYFERWFLEDFSWLGVGSSYRLSNTRSILFVQLNHHLVPSSPQNYPIYFMPQLLYN
jgi:hypothetical protein